MTDNLFSQYIHYGTAAERAAFTPDPPGGSYNPLYIWFETDTGDTYAYHGSWTKVNTVSGSNALAHLESHTAISSATLDFTSWYSSTYDIYLIEFLNILPATDDQHLQALVSTDGGSTWASSGYDRMAEGINSGNAWASSGASAQSVAQLIANIDNASTNGVSGTLKFYNPGSGSAYKVCHGKLMGFINTSGRWALWETGFGYNSATAVNAIRFQFGSGNIASGTIRIYGMSH